MGKSVWFIFPLFFFAGGALFVAGQADEKPGDEQPLENLGKESAVKDGATIERVTKRSVENKKSAEAQNCGICHLAHAPTSEIPDLKECTRPGKTSSDRASPDAVVIDQVQALGASDAPDLYAPVVFSHALHMGEPSMGSNCEACHHHNAVGKILACRECHGRMGARENLWKPGLKGAYHRQCLDCHREWGHATKCEFCHAKRNPGSGEGVRDVADWEGRKHPEIPAQSKILYQTPESGVEKLVPFYHDQHARLFDLQCADCHGSGSCATCHEIEGTETASRAGTPHARCDGCHTTSVAKADGKKPTPAEREKVCSVCHVDKDRGGFDHGRRTGFALKRFHLDASCAQCHQDMAKGFAGLKPVCAECHAEDWFPEDFNHALTGLVMDEDHEDLDCDSCHTGGLGKKVTCGDCHDDDPKIDYPDKLPGKRVQAQ